MIEVAQKQVATVANVALTKLHWQIGHHVRTHVLEGRRAEHGGQIFSTASRPLAQRYGRGFNDMSLRHMVQFATAFPDREIVSTTWRQFTWSPFKVLIYLKDPLARDFYFDMCRIERWSVRELGARIQSMLVERTALSKKPKELIKKELTAPRDHLGVHRLKVRRHESVDFDDVAPGYREESVTCMTPERRNAAISN